MGEGEQHAKEYDEKHKGFILARFAKHDLCKRLMEMSQDEFGKWWEEQLRENSESVECAIGEKEWQRRLTLAQIQATIEATAKQVEATIKAAESQAGATIKAAQQQSEATIKGAQKQVESVIAYELGLVVTTAIGTSARASKSSNSTTPS